MENIGLREFLVLCKHDVMPIGYSKKKDIITIKLDKYIKENGCYVTIFPFGKNKSESSMMFAYRSSRDECSLPKFLIKGIVCKSWEEIHLYILDLEKLINDKFFDKQKNNFEDLV